MAYSSITVGTTSTLVVEANPQRHSIIITNEGISVIFLGNDNAVTTATGISLSSGSNLTEDSSGTKLYGGAYYAIAASGSATVRYWERIR